MDLIHDPVRAVDSRGRADTVVWVQVLAQALGDARTVTVFVSAAPALVRVSTSHTSFSSLLTL
jgi:hypothetical protein